VVAVLDPRLAKASYRWNLVRALPPMRRTRHVQEVADFLAPLRDPQ
jgi:ATP-dependent DNA helicase DinG